MKKLNKIFISILATITFPLNALAYSEYIIPGGESVGIEIKSDGILVVGFYKVNGKYNKGNPNIKVGDKIIEVNDKSVNTVEELVQSLENNVAAGKATLKVIRDGKTKTVDLELVKEGATYKTGLYVKDEITGIGTLTYIDPDSLIYGALGHNVVETNTNRLVEVKTGTIFRSSITSIDRSVAGTPGGKNAKFYSSSIYGDIKKNTTSGIYGIYTDTIPNKETKKVATVDEIKLGEAKILTVLDGETLGEYTINITKLDPNNNTKNIYFEVTDERLLEKTGGIVQGMSGSPIIQDDMIVGAVTHVVISNPSNGYGINITTMLEEGEKKK